MKIINKIFIIVILISIIFISFSCQSQQQNKLVVPLNSFSSNKFVSNDFIYAPKNSSFKIIFPMKPEISNTLDLNHKNILSEVAELSIPPDSYIKSELIFLDLKDKRKVTEKILKEYSFANGLIGATVTEKTTNVGSCLELRGYKYLKFSPKDSAIAVTYTAKCFSDKESILALFAACESKDYPTPAITKFYESIAFQ